MGIVPRAGFETSFPLAVPARYARAVALDGNHKILRASGTFDIDNGLVLPDAQPPVEAVMVKDPVVIDDGGDADGYVAVEFLTQKQQSEGFWDEFSPAWQAVGACALLFVLLGVWVV